MNYELAKKLKDAGFKWPTDCYRKAIWTRDETPEHDIGKTRMEIPTLSELIDACGDGFFNLARLEKDRWCTQFDEDQNTEGTTQGSTPEEAVANLWLELNKK